MMTCKEKAEEWGVSVRTVNDLCKKGKVPGVIKEGGIWRIPDAAPKPADGRVITGKYKKNQIQNEKKPLPIGIGLYESSI